jgi:glyoxylase-like metal-dependent hydrolase (beta-lactamase superfamily II)
MLIEVAEGVLVHESEFLQSNAVIVRGRDGVLLIDPGITSDELSSLAADLRTRGLRVVAGFSTHPDWDHVLWHADLGDAPRFATAPAAASLADLLAQADWREQVAEGLPPEHADEIPMELLGLVTALPPGTASVPWDGPAVRILQHRGHAPGHAALLVEEAAVLVAGDMLSDILMPFLDLQAEHPIEDYLAALELFDGVAADVSVVVPGHGSVGVGGEVRVRIDRDRAYVEALRAGRDVEDPRVGPSAPLDWLVDVHDWQVDRIAQARRAAALRTSILELLERRADTATICPSDAARAVGGDEWRELMEPAREAARALVAEGVVEITQGGEVVDPATAKGPIRIRRRRP